MMQSEYWRNLVLAFISMNKMRGRKEIIMEEGKIISADFDGDEKLLLSWLEHRESVIWHEIKYFDDHYEIYWRGESGTGDALNEFLDLIEGPGKSIDV